ncbi:uncharacterized protein LOC105425885 [Pogonomyrmex barbatus]|uniref:Uncharacterized protein LOC105425885 n=1 Tax=Pogonomyrmex barbatus TaxID=144034 RepID=A0A6I9WT95_9HYME|nr:uncharacterized protein LOC105425885 [Pogonomyrmex barbatus]
MLLDTKNTNCNEYKLDCINTNKNMSDVTKSSTDADEDEPSEYAPSRSASSLPTYSDENNNTKNNRKNVSINKSNMFSGLVISNVHSLGTKTCDDSEMYVTESSRKQTYTKKLFLLQKTAEQNSTVLRNHILMKRKLKNLQYYRKEIPREKK